MTGATELSSSRLAIIRAARIAFGHRPYRSVTLRDIAADAGVSAALIVKHFGGKEQLFDRVADFAGAAELLLDSPTETLGAHLVTTVVRVRREKQVDPLLRVVFAIGAQDERTLLLARFRDQVVLALTARLTGPEADLRAELVLAQLLGLGAMMSIDRDGPLGRASIVELAGRYGPSLQSLVDG